MKTYCTHSNKTNCILPPTPACLNLSPKFGFDRLSYVYFRGCHGNLYIDAFIFLIENSAKRYIFIVRLRCRIKP